MLPDGALDAISRTLGDAMIGSDITRVLRSCGLHDTSGESTKWKRLYRTFIILQERDKVADNVITLVECAMSPARWAQESERHEHSRGIKSQSLVRRNRNRKRRQSPTSRIGILTR